MKSFQLFSLSRNNSLLLIFVLTVVFFVPILPREEQAFFYSVVYSFIFFSSIFALEYRRRILVGSATTVFILVWVAQLLHLPLLFSISSFLTMVFFTFVVVRLVFQIARSQRVDVAVILEAINGYLLIGLTFSLFVSVVVRFNPNAFTITNMTGDLQTNFIYYTFVTMTTLGYGDIVPVSPAAKSLAMLISISGQMYMAIIIALLVGKYSASR